MPSDRNISFVTATMSTMIQVFVMASPHRYSICLLCALLVVASSFSTLLSSNSPSQKHAHTLYTNSIASLHEKQQKGVLTFQRTCGSPLVLSMSSQTTTAEDNQEVQDVFSKYCDKDSLIDRKTLESMPPFADMLAEEDLLPEELNGIWEAAKKDSGDSSRIDVLSFVKIYNEVDDLFEDDDDEEDMEDGEEAEDTDDNNNVAINDGLSSPKIEKNEIEKNELDEELLSAYKSLCDGKGLISKEKMMQWEEIASLLNEGLLGDEEFEELWINAANSKNGSLDASAFSAFNLALDDLFEIDDDDEAEEDSTTIATAAVRTMVIEGDMPPGVLFSQLADKEYLVGMNELKLWTELTELLEEGDLLESELQDIFDKYATPGPSGKLTESSFLQLYDEIDALFEEVDDEEVEDSGETAATSTMQQQRPPMNARVKEDLLAFIDLVIEDDEEPCGFGTSESDQGQILNIVQVLEQQATNMILEKEGNIELFDVAGNWELIYTSSSAMKFNQGLSGIGGSFPNGRFGGVRQELKATKFTSDMEYKERVEVNPSSASFDVTINGLWDLEKSVSLFTGQPTIILSVEPYKVRYGLTTTRADHWKSLGPVNRLDLSYLDDNLRVMRGCTSSDTLLIFKKV
mmetsp:Transcript_6707/g.16473  ORF Transcript_6707/g.16473 Transcript_6707/m.16473 type:complete len:631 (-) Transcript_6707:53-1945(-)